VVREARDIIAGVESIGAARKRDLLLVADAL
jgi:hypothetical protein